MGIEGSATGGLNLPFGQDDSRYVEIWNLVFMQFDRSAIADENGEKRFVLTPLPKPSIDTGMGLERVAAVLQGKVSNFETDLFRPLVEAAAGFVEFKYPESQNFASEEEWQESKAIDRLNSASLRIIADHSRAATFLISDGVLPSNEGRGYVLRKIMRRAIRHGRLLGQEKPFLFEMVYVVRDLMHDAYPELVDLAPRVAKVVKTEEKQFDRVLKIGALALEKEIESAFAEAKQENQREMIRINERENLLIRQFIDEDPTLKFNDRLAASSEDHSEKAAAERAVSESIEVANKRAAEAVAEERRNAVLPPLKLRGDRAFHLYETYGLPKDFIQDACHDAGIDFDDVGFEAARAEEQARARASWKGGSQKSASPAYRELPKTDFLGYKQLTAQGAEVLAIVKDGVGVPAAAAGELVDVVLDQTSFYGDSGGQTGDTGWFTSADGNTTVAEIQGAVLPVQGVRAHKALLKESLAVGDHVRTVVDGERRDAIRRNHTGTHLLHAALRQVLGTHVKQAGSAVHPDRLRFDFSHFAQVADEELEEIESIVNREVLADARVETIEDVPIDVAVNEYHAMALFGEKYGDKVRVVKLSDGFSTELCGGTHTRATGEIGLIKIVSEGSVSSGVRRLEAITGMGALDAFRQDFAVSQIVTQLAPPAAGGSLSDSFRAKLASQEDELKRLRRELEEARMKSAAGALDEALARGVDVKGVRLVTLRADSLERGQLRTLVDNLKQKLGEGVVVLASAQPEGKVALIAGVTPGLTKRIQAGKLVGAVAKLVGGSGGGKPEIAEAGGKDQAGIDAALKAAAGLVGELLG
jgi:alanyl-tRNA synthetase